MKEDPFVQLAATIVALMLAAILAFVLDRLRKKFIEPLSKTVLGGDKEPDLRQMVEDVATHSRVAAQNSTAAVQGVVQVREDLHIARGEIRTDISAVKDTVRTLESKVDANRSHHDAVSREHAKQIEELRSTDKTHIDQLARIESVLNLRDSDRKQHETVISHFKRDRKDSK